MRSCFNFESEMLSFNKKLNLSLLQFWAKQHPLILQVSLLWQMFSIQALFGPEHGLPEQCLFTSRSFLRNPKSTQHQARLPSTQPKKNGLKFCLKSECCSGTGHLQLWQEATDARAVEKLRHQSRFSKVKMESSHSVDSVGQWYCAVCTEHHCTSGQYHWRSVPKYHSSMLQWSVPFNPPHFSLSVGLHCAYNSTTVSVTSIAESIQNTPTI